MLKADLHIHTKEDPEDYYMVEYNAKQLIDKAASLSFEVLAITCHDKIIYNEDLKKYAANKGILLIPGVEISVEKKHILVYNIEQEEVDKVKKLDDLNLLRRKDSLIIAPHPFFILSSIGKKRLLKYIDFFDAIEYSHFYIKSLNLNKAAVKIAKRYKKPIIGSSDAHRWYQFNSTYSLIDSKKDVKSVIEAIKQNKVKLVTRPLKFRHFFMTFIRQTINLHRKFYKP